MTGTQAAENVAKSAFDAARDIAAQAEWDFHYLIVKARQQVVAQFGDDSNEAQAMGLTKKSERKKPGGKRKPPSKPA